MFDVLAGSAWCRLAPRQRSTRRRRWSSTLSSKCRWRSETCRTRWSTRPTARRRRFAAWARRFRSRREATPRWRRFVTKASDFLAGKVVGCRLQRSSWAWSRMFLIFQLLMYLCDNSFYLTKLWEFTLSFLNFCENVKLSAVSWSCSKN